MAYHIVDKLRIQIHLPYCNMATLRLYTRDKHVVWNSITDHSAAISNDECESLRNSVFNGEAVGGGYIYRTDILKTSHGRVEIRGGWRVSRYPMYTIN